MVQTELDLEKAEEPEVKLRTSVGSLKKQGNSIKTSTSASLTTLNPLCGSQQIGKFLKRLEYQTSLRVSWETCTQVKRQQFEPDMEQQQIGSKLGKEYIKAVYCHPAYLFNLHAEYIMRNAGLGQSHAGIKIAWRNINNLRYADGTTSIDRRWRGTKEPLDECEKVDLKLSIQKTKIITSWQIDRGKVETVADFIFLGSKSLQTVTAAMKFKDVCSLEKTL